MNHEADTLDKLILAAIAMNDLWSYCWNEEKAENLDKAMGALETAFDYFYAGIDINRLAEQHPEIVEHYKRKGAC